MSKILSEKFTANHDEISNLVLGVIFEHLRANKKRFNLPEVLAGTCAALFQLMFELFVKEEGGEEKANEFIQRHKNVGLEILHGVQHQIQDSSKFGDLPDSIIIFNLIAVLESYVSLSAVSELEEDK